MVCSAEHAERERERERERESERERDREREREKRERIPDYTLAYIYGRSQAINDFVWSFGNLRLV